MGWELSMPVFVDLGVLKGLEEAAAQAETWPSCCSSVLSGPHRVWPLLPPCISLKGERRTSLVLTASPCPPCRLELGKVNCRIAGVKLLDAMARLPEAQLAPR